MHDGGFVVSVVVSVAGRAPRCVEGGEAVVRGRGSAEKLVDGFFEPVVKGGIVVAGRNVLVARAVPGSLGIGCVGDDVGVGASVSNTLVVTALVGGNMRIAAGLSVDCVEGRSVVRDGRASSGVGDGRESGPPWLASGFARSSLARAASAASRACILLGVLIGYHSDVLS